MPRGSHLFICATDLNHVSLEMSFLYYRRKHSIWMMKSTPPAIRRGNCQNSVKIEQLLFKDKRSLWSHDTTAFWVSWNIRLETLLSFDTIVDWNFNFSGLVHIILWTKVQTTRSISRNLEFNVSIILLILIISLPSLPLTLNSILMGIHWNRFLSPPCVLSFLKRFYRSMREGRYASCRSRQVLNGGWCYRRRRSL